MTPSSYWQDARAPRYSLLLALPLLLIYEVLAASLAGSDGGLRNGADVILQMVVVSVAGARGTLYVTGAVILLCVAWIVRDARRAGGIRSSYLPLMLLEAAGLAVVFAVVVSLATTQLLTRLGAALTTVSGQVPAVPTFDTPTAIMLSLGAGLYEELLFRVLLVTTLAAAARVVFGAGPVVAGTIAAVLGALVFSAFHYVGAYGDPFSVDSFTFRAIAGLAFSGLYLTRGFGITAWTHALYDIGVLVL